MPTRHVNFVAVGRKKIPCGNSQSRMWICATSRVKKLQLKLNLSSKDVEAGLKWRELENRPRRSLNVLNSVSNRNFYISTDEFSRESIIELRRSISSLVFDRRCEWMLRVRRVRPPERMSRSWLTFRVFFLQFSHFSAAIAPRGSVASEAGPGSDSTRGKSRRREEKRWKMEGEKRRLKTSAWVHGVIGSLSLPCICIFFYRPAFFRRREQSELLMSFSFMDPSGSASPLSLRTGSMIKITPRRWKFFHIMFFLLLLYISKSFILAASF